MHTISNKWAGSLQASYLQPMQLIPLTPHALISTWSEVWGDASNPHRLPCKLADPSYMHIALSSAVHIILHTRNSTVHCPARSGIVGVANNYVHCWRFFTSQWWQHNCIIISESASYGVPMTNWVTCGPSVIPLRITWLTNITWFFEE